MIKKINILLVSSSLVFANSEICLKHYKLSPKTQALINPVDKTFRSNEVLIIQDSNNQQPTIHVISSNLISDFKYSNDEFGDHLSTSLKIPKNQSQANNTSNSPTLGSSSSGSALQISGGNKTNSNIIIKTGSDLAKLNVNDKRTILENYFRDEYSSQSLPLDAASLKYLVEFGMKDPTTLDYATRFHNKGPNSTAFFSDYHHYNLTNEGVQRYFRFKPSESEAFVNARVLDIHRWNKYPEAMSPELNRRNTQFTGVSILVEWLGTADSNGIQKKHIAYLKPAEINSIEILKDEQRLVVQEGFNDTLNLMELQTKKLAQALNVRTYGFTNKDRVPGLEANDGIDPLTMMNNISHLAMRSWSQAKFGSELGKVIDLLATKEEKQDPLLNIIDLMGKLNPRYILEKFKTAANSWEYLFVITEDGQLKISIHGHAGNNLKAQSLRLAGGKRVFAAGKFTIDGNDKLNINLKSNAYQDIDANFGARNAFRSRGNEGLDFFITQAFLMQAGKQVESINDSRTESFYEYNYFEDLAQNQRHSTNYKKQAYGQENGNFDSRNTFNFVNDLYKEMNRPNQKVAETIWNPDSGKEAPLEFDAWIKKTGQESYYGRDKLKMDWAHYVLNTNSDMPIDKIKKTYRALINKFHEDKNKSEIAKTIATQLTVAWGILKAKMD